MNCKRGIFIKSQNQRVPCGQCMPCRINKGRLWSARIVMEWLTHYSQTGLNSQFITLTYNDDAIPRTIEGDPTLRKRETLQWLKNQQKQTAGSRKFRYYIVGEYGEKFRRPHYHVALFPGHVEQPRALAEHWSKTRGFVSVYEMSDARARYLANYTAKKLTKGDDERLLPGQEPEFRTSSRTPPLGADFADVLISQYTTREGSRLLAEHGDIHRTFRTGGRIYPIPPWILNKARAAVGVPLLHRERIDANPNYLDYFETEEATWEPEEAKALEAQLIRKADRKLHRTPHAKL